MNIESALKSQYHAALKALRIAIEKFVDHLVAEGTDLNVKIGYLVKK